MAIYRHSNVKIGKYEIDNVELQLILNKFFVLQLVKNLDFLGTEELAQLLLLSYKQTNAKFQSNELNRLELFDISEKFNHLINDLLKAEIDDLLS